MANIALYTAVVYSLYRGDSAGGVGMPLIP